MLTQRIPGPQLQDPMVRVRVLRPFYVAGRLCEPGVTISMTTSDAQAGAKNAIPPTVEIL
jgi:hypothetical protein